VTRYLKRRFLVVLLFVGVGFGISLASRSILTQVVERQIAETAADWGLEIEYAGIDVGLGGTIGIQHVTISMDELGRVDIAEIRATIDLSRAFEGRLYFDRVELIHPSVRLEGSVPGSMFRRRRPTGSSRPTVATRQPATMGRPMNRPSEPRPTRRFIDIPVREIVIRDLQIEVERAMVIDLDLRLTESRGAYHLAGSGQLVSVYAGVGQAGFTVEGVVDIEASELELAIDLNQAIAIETDAGTVSFARLGLDARGQSEVWVEDVVVLPDLIDFTDAWRAESIRATLLMAEGIVPERVIITGFKGELDLVAISELAEWLVERPSKSMMLDRDLVDLRTAILEVVADARGSLYGLQIEVAAEEGDLRLLGEHGSSWSLSALDLDLDGAARSSRPSLSLSYLGPEISGGLTILISDLTARSIAEWTR
jgi:hypothetical protein